MKNLISGLIFCIVCVYAQDIAPTIDNTNDWAVKVILANGSEVKGIVMSDRFIEKTKQGRIYEEVDNYRLPDAGIRVWYVKSNPGFIFLPYKDIKLVVRLGKLTPESRAKVEDRIRMKTIQAQQSTDQERQEKQDRLKKAGIGVSEEEEKKLLEKEASALMEKAKQKVNKDEIFKNMPPELAQLLQDFPPENGWGESLFKKLNAQSLKGMTKFVTRVINGKEVIQKGAPRGGLTAEEDKFVDKFEQWKQALIAYKESEDALAKKIQEGLLADQKGKEAEKDTTKKTPTPEEPAETPKNVENRSENTTPSSAMSLQDIINKSMEQLNYGNKQEKLKGMQSLIGLNQRIASITPTLKVCLKDESPEIRQKALIALAKIGGPLEEVNNILADSLEQGDVMMRREAAALFMNLGKMAEPKLDTIGLALGDDDPIVRFRLIRALESIGKSNAIQYVKDRMWDGDNAVQVAACHALLMLMSNVNQLEKFVRQPLFKGLSHKEEEIQFLSAEAIQKLVEGMAKVDVEKLALIREELETKSGQIESNVRSRLQTIIAIAKEEERRASEAKAAKETESKKANPEQPEENQNPEENND